MRFVCPTHGEFEPTEGIMYSCPAQAGYPSCDYIASDLDGFIKVMSGEEAYRCRPSIYHSIIKETAEEEEWFHTSFDSDDFLEFASLRLIKDCPSGAFKDRCQHDLPFLLEEWNQSH